MARYRISGDPKQRGKRRAKAGAGTEIQAGERQSLAGLPMFADMPGNVLEEIEEKCRWRDSRAGERIIERGQKSSDVYIILSGNAHVLNFSNSGRVVDYASLNAGDIFGELAAIDGQPRSATVVTRTPCQMAIIEGESFMDLVLKYPGVTSFVLKRLSSVVRTGDDRITDLSLLGAEQRVCLELLRMARPDPAYMKNLVIYPVPTQTLIANGIGVSRETVARIFGRLAKQRIIERKAKTLYIRDRDKLEELAMSEDHDPTDRSSKSDD